MSRVRGMSQRRPTFRAGNSPLAQSSRMVFSENGRICAASFGVITSGRSAIKILQEGVFASGS